MNVPRLELSDVSIGYSEWRAGGISLSLQAGELVAIVGPSGCGKSTLLKTVLGALPALSGRIKVDSTDVTNLNIKDRGIGVVFQEPLLFPQLNVFENVAFGLRQQHSKEIEAQVQQLLELVQLPKPWHKRVDELSGGQMQRVALARALAPRPAALLFDEPLSALDAELRVDLGHAIRNSVKSSAAAALYVTHDLEEAKRVCDRVLNFNDLAMSR